MRTSSEYAFVDTNVLVHALDSVSVDHERCLALLNQAQIGEVSLCIAPQVLFEFFVVTTSPVRSRTPRTIMEALIEMEKFSIAFRMIHPPADVHLQVIEMFHNPSLRPQQVFDAAIVATMLATGVTRIYTLDHGFQRISGVTVLTP